MNEPNNHDDDFIIEQESPTGEPQRPDSQSSMLSPARGFQWLERGLSDIYIPHFKNWFIVGLIFSVITSLIPAFIPQIALLVGVLNPMFLAGALIGADRIYNKTGSVVPTQIFEAFTHPQRVNIWIYTIVTVVLVIILILILGAIIGPENLASIDLARIEAGDQAYTKSVMEIFAPAIPWAILMGIALSLATWFAPSLILFHQKKAIPAVIDSFMGGVKNILPMIVMIMITVAALLVLFIVLGLVLTMFGNAAQNIYFQLVLNIIASTLAFPILISVTYIAYREIFLGDIKKSEKSL